MTYQELQKQLNQLDALRELRILLPNASQVAAHFHLTEVGFETKDFIDCGGTRRQSANCLFQILVSTDDDHRFPLPKFRKILAMAHEKIGQLSDCDIQIELTGKNSIERYGLKELRPDSTFVLNSLATTCLAPGSCALPVGDDQICHSQSCC